MDKLLQIAGDVEFWKILAPVLTVVLGWLLNEAGRRKSEREKRFLERFERKEKSYRRMLENSKGFISAHLNAEKRQSFVDELQLCWLHASDEVILKAYAFLDSVHTDNLKSKTDADREKAFAEFISALRKDAFSQELESTRLSSKDYRLLTSNYER